MRAGTLIAAAILAASPLARAQTVVSTPLLTNASSLDEGVDPSLRFGWEQKGPVFKYRHAGTSGPPPAGIDRAAITVFPGLPTAGARLLAKGRFSDYTVAGIPVRLTVSVNGIANGATQCADETFADDPLGNPERCDPVTASGWLRCD